ncbi:MAG: cysteine desulfurase [Alphaproteobacteria bacterium]|nr:cysteine desulfurase [Alphaproteobacteria bacterium]
MTNLRAYLDYNASAPLLPEAASAVLQVLENAGNPSSVHREGIKARRILDHAREVVAKSVGAQGDSVVFTSGGTEANVLALVGAPGARRIVSAVEHPSVLKTAAEVDPHMLTAPVDGTGMLDLDVLAGYLRQAGPSTLVSIQWVNNETGVIQSMAEIVAAVHGAGAILHVDAVQALGKLQISFHESGIDLLTLSAHKVGGPTGVGALIVRPGLSIAPLLTGGLQERGLRAGTENVAGIAGFAAALISPRFGVWAQIGAWRDDLERRVRALPGVQVMGTSAPRVVNTSCIACDGLDGATQVAALDLDGVAISAGAACSSGKVEPSHVLSAMGVAPERARSAIRVSLGWQNTKNDVDRFVDAYGVLVRRLARRLTVNAA